MLYKPKNLYPSSKLGPVVYRQKERDFCYDFSCQADGNEQLDETIYLQVGSPYAREYKDFSGESLEINSGKTHITEAISLFQPPTEGLAFKIFNENYQSNCIEYLKNDSLARDAMNFVTYYKITSPGNTNAWSNLAAPDTLIQVMGKSIAPVRKEISGQVIYLYSYYTPLVGTSVIDYSQDIPNESNMILSIAPGTDFEKSVLRDNFNFSINIQEQGKVSATLYYSTYVGKDSMNALIEEHRSVEDSETINSKLNINFLWDDMKLKQQVSGSNHWENYLIYSYSFSLLDQNLTVIDGIISFAYDKDKGFVYLYQILLNDSTVAYNFGAFSKINHKSYHNSLDLESNAFVDKREVAEKSKIIISSYNCRVNLNLSLKKENTNFSKSILDYTINITPEDKSPIYATDATGQSQIINLENVELQNVYNRNTFNGLLNLSPNKNELMWRIGYKAKESYSDYVFSTWETFYCGEEKPDVNIILPTEDNNFLGNVTFKGQFKPSKNSLLNESLVNFSWKLFYEGKLLKEINNIYSQDFRFTHEDFIPGSYIISASVEDNYGNHWTSDSFSFTVEYNTQEEAQIDTCLIESNTGVYVKFTKPKNVDRISSFRIKRKNVFSQRMLDLGKYNIVYANEESLAQHLQIIDYSVPHHTEVEYLIYYQHEDKAFNPIVSNIVKTNWDKWCLFTTKGASPKILNGSAKSECNENVLLVDKIFFFEMNVETGNMTNNTDFSIVKNFTPYPQVQRSPSNYWSGQLKSLLGRLAIDGATFKQTPDMLQELKELTQNTSRKFLKDRDGNFWEVELSSAITIDNNDKLDVQLKTKSFNWVEVGDASDIALISIGAGQEDWLLTELGQEKIDLGKYTWDDDAIWDDSDFWTEVK